MNPLSKSSLPAAWSDQAGELLRTLQDWPWLDTLRTLRQRFREDHLGLTASSLTFTTLIALVPLVTVMLAVFSAFPIFAGFQGALEKYFLQNLIPDHIARPVMAALTQFARQATRLGSVGLAVLLLTAIALMLTIDRALNGIWRVRRPRPLAQRVLVYWAGITLGPLLLGVSLTATAFALKVSRQWLGADTEGVATVLNVVQFGLVVAAAAGLFHYVPNTWVRWRHALAGGLFVAVGLEAAKQALGWYLARVPTYESVYGAFATVPILLVWVYCVWVVVLLGAVIAAYAPSLRMRVGRRLATPGHRFELAVQLLALLARARRDGANGLALADMATALRTDPLQIEPVLDQLIDFDWIGRLDEDGAQRHVLLCDPVTTPAARLLDELLLAPSTTTAPLRERMGAVTLGDLLR